MIDLIGCKADPWSIVLSFRCKINREKKEREKKRSGGEEETILARRRSVLLFMLWGNWEVVPGQCMHGQCAIITAPVITAMVSNIYFEVCARPWSQHRMDCA